MFFQRRQARPGVPRRCIRAKAGPAVHRLKQLVTATACMLCLLTALPGSGNGISATGSDGVTVTLPQPAQRIIALAPHLAENLFAAGAGNALVATVEYSDYPAAARDIPRIGGYNSLSIEAMVAQRPDLVLAWGSGTGSNIVRRLREFGIPVYTDEIRRLADIPDSLRAIGRLSGTEKSAARSINRFEQGLTALRENSTGSMRLAVFYQIWHDPLQTIGGEHLISEVIALCGGYNIFNDVRGLAPRISRESVLLRNPDVIVASGSSQSVANWLSQWRSVTGLRAVQTDALYIINPDLIERPTPRLLSGARQLCTKLDSARAALAD